MQVQILTRQLSVFSTALLRSFAPAPSHVNVHVHCMCIMGMHTWLLLHMHVHIYVCTCTCTRTCGNIPKTRTGAHKSLSLLSVLVSSPPCIVNTHAHAYNTIIILFSWTVLPKDFMYITFAEQAFQLAIPIHASQLVGYNIYGERICTILMQYYQRHHWACILGGPQTMQ